MSEYHVLSLGAGVQSTRLYLKFVNGEMPHKLDAAIFADTQEEPEAVYHHLEWLRSLGGPPILTGSAGKLGDDLVSGRNSTGGRFASIPAFTTIDGGRTVGITRRQCSKEYKTEVIGKVLRREVLGLQPGRSAPKGVSVVQYIGFSLDEGGRAARLSRIPTARYIKRSFPLIEALETRANCVTELKDKVPHKTPRSACVFCPYHDDNEWDLIKRTDESGWSRAVEVDHALRSPGSIVNRGMDQAMYLHRSCKPLDLVQLQPKPPSSRAVQLPMGFHSECEGVCGV